MSAIERVSRLTDAAHAAGIEEVVLWTTRCIHWTITRSASGQDRAEQTISMTRSSGPGGRWAIVDSWTRFLMPTVWC